MKELIYSLGIKIHVLAGTLSLLFGLAAMLIKKKGGKRHNQAGIVFYWSMAAVFVTTVLFMVLYPTQLKYHFFLTIGIVSFYPTYSGKRILKMKKGISPEWFDWTAAYIILFSGLAMIVYAVYLQIYLPNSFTVLFFVFGVFSLVQAISDLKLFLGKKSATKLHWFFSHAGKMIGAYSAAVTAFCVNIVPRFLPENTSMSVLIFTWVAPSILFAFVTRYFFKKYQKQFKMG